MSRYFHNFPKVTYDISSTNSVDIVSNLTTKIAFSPEFKNDSSVYEEYLVSDGESPESISHKLYGMSERHWIILSFNDIIDPLFDWVLDVKTLHNLIDNKYSTAKFANTANTSVSGAQWAKSNNKEYYKIITHTEKINNTKTETRIVINQSEYANVATSSVNYTLGNGIVINKKIDKDVITYYDYEVELNDKKRLIKLPKKTFIDAIEREFEKLTNNE